MLKYFVTDAQTAQYLSYGGVKEFIAEFWREHGDKDERVEITEALVEADNLCDLNQLLINIDYMVASYEDDEYYVIDLNATMSLTKEEIKDFIVDFWRENLEMDDVEANIEDVRNTDDVWELNEFLNGFDYKVVKEELSW